MLKRFIIVLCAAILIGETTDLHGQPRGGSQERVYKSQIVPHWFDEGDRFWYRNDLRGGEREYVLVDAVKGERKHAFDHARLAKVLRESGVQDAQAKRLALEGLAFDSKAGTVLFRAGRRDWRCDLATYEIEEVKERELSRTGDGFAMHPGDAPRASTRTGEETELRFLNRTPQAVEILWLDTDGRRRSYGQVEAGSETRQRTYAGHVWLVVDADGQAMVAFQAEARPRVAVISNDNIPRQSREGSPPRRAPVVRRDTSPDGKWRAFVREGNVFVRANGTEHDVQLSTDGSLEIEYQMLQWAPDSRGLVAFRAVPGEQQPVYLIESSPRGGGRAVMHERNYALPGDRFTSYELKLFRLNAAENEVAQPRWDVVKADVEPVDFGRPRVRWNRGGHSFTYIKVDRGHQRYRLIEVDTHTGYSRNIIDEQTDTFIWTAHVENIGVPLVTWLQETDELIYASEVGGWRHLYLIDPKIETADSAAAEPQVVNEGKRLFAPGLKTQITQGEFVVRRVDRIDEQRRQIWFRASGIVPGQDPYLIHYCRVNFDGTGFVRLTEGDGNHSVEFSPDGRFVIDSYSRVDMAPVHELRRVEDGELVCQLEEADVSELTDAGWKPPQVFVAKGRDGETDICGIICRPRNFDPKQKYPVLEDIYAGPQGSFVPKTFSSRDRYRTLNDLGFIVVKIDGMGTANRSKAFHDVCWHNLKDAGFADRILWMKAAAAEHPEMDLSRVGIYGGSAGGQNAAAAVLFHGDFYKAAVAGCGCHDNRMDKASWNEQWMGYPVGPQYSESSNIDNARRLRGNLLLIVGELDRNVPPESTLRFADALIKANKDFDLLVVPGAGHGMGGAYGQRRLQQFFVRHLLQSGAD